MIQEITIGLVLYALAVAFLQSGAVWWIAKPYMECKKGKQYGFFLVFLLLSWHDLFFSLWSCSEENFVLCSIEMLIFYPLIGFVIWRTFKENVYRNFVYIFSVEWCYQIFGMLFSFPAYMVICGFDIEKVGLFLDSPSWGNLCVIVILYVIDAWVTAKIWKGLCKLPNSLFKVLCFLFCFLDIVTLMMLGWKTIVITIPVLVLMIFALFFSQNHNEKIMKDQYAYYQALEEVQREKAKEISEIRHDIANHLSVMEEMSKDKPGQDILRKIDRGYGVITGVPVLDCLIGEKEKQCLEKEIAFYVKSGLLGEISVSEFDLISLFANLLDNAIEAAEKTDEKQVNLTIEKQQGYMKITLYNSKTQDASPIETKFATTKKDKKNHGIGNRIIQKVVGDYNGRIRYEDQGGGLYVYIVMEL
ncbi:MAG: GHKL domain-containing protein [Lachnospiraceae bacterium]|nr:GHKL domain-containing protein [Lachnospiraceae bacterium]